MIALEDDIHCERVGHFVTFEEAIAELTRRAAIPWDRPPNVAPCTSWRTCGRDYRLLEYDTSSTPWTPLRSVAVLAVSAAGAKWVEGFERDWSAAGDERPRGSTGENG
jgi:hypothetical protein